MSLKIASKHETQCSYSILNVQNRKYLKFIICIITYNVLAAASFSAVCPILLDLWWKQKQKQPKKHEQPFHFCYGGEDFNQFLVDIQSFLCIIFPITESDHTYHQKNLVTVHSNCSKPSPTSIIPVHNHLTATRSFFCAALKTGGLFSLVLC